jgi:NhaC family Na+:H+ antiporter
MSQNNNADKQDKLPSLAISIVPVALLLLWLIGLIVFKGTDAVSQYSPIVLLASGALSLLLAAATKCINKQNLIDGFKRSAQQILPTVPLLILIALVSTTWMLSGVVPTFIDYGLQVLNPQFFLALTCAVCAFVSVLTGSSWTTIATIGVALMGIGTVMGYSEGWIAGAIISGAYFGDKISPLSDTTVIASSSCNVDLFDHIRYLMVTTVPAMSLSLIIFMIDGLFLGGANAQEVNDSELINALHSTFNISPWVLIVPAITATLIALRVNTLITLAASAVAGFVAMFVFQPQIVADINVLHALWSDTSFTTNSARLNDLVSTSGIMGMMNTIELVLCAMIFGAALLGTGMLRSIANAFTHRLSHRRSVVSATVGSGLFLNCCTADQYLSIIICSNMYRDVYQRFSLEPRLLSRTIEDSVSVTSVLIPWNSCGVTHSAVLGVPTLTYLPYCLFNILSPLMSLVMIWTGYRVRTLAVNLQK